MSDRLGPAPAVKPTVAPGPKPGSGGASSARASAVEGPDCARLMILCAGEGQRLRPLTDGLPKPLVPVGDRPLLLSHLQYASARGHDTVILNERHCAAALDGVLPDSPRVLRSREQSLLGTAGGVHAVRRWMPEGGVVWNGDMSLEPPLAELVLASQQPDRICLLVSRRASGAGAASGSLAVGAGTVGTDSAGRVVRLRGERFGVEQRAFYYLGVVALGAGKIEALPAQGCLAGDYWLPHLRRGGRIDVLEFEGDWRDIGTLQSYQHANLEWLQLRGLSHWAAPSARIQPGLELQASIVHAEARVEGTGGLERCVVWPGARCVAPLSDCAVLADGRVVSLTPC